MIVIQPICPEGAAPTAGVAASVQNSVEAIKTRRLVSDRLVDDGIFMP